MNKSPRLFMNAVILISMSVSAFAAPPASVFFDEKVLFKAHEESKDDSRIAEYIPKDESLDSWKSLAGLFWFSEISSPKEFAEAMMESIQASSAEAKINLSEKPGSTDVLLDFVMWPEDQKFVEFDVFHIAKDGKNGIKAQQYARRAYGKEMEKFLAALPDERLRLLNFMATKGLKEP